MTDVPLTRLGVPRAQIRRTGDTADGYRAGSPRRLPRVHNPFSFLELGLVVAVVGVAAAVAVPEYVQPRQAASDVSAGSRLTAAAPTLQAHHLIAGAFTGSRLPAGVRLHTAGGSYCIEAGAGGHVWRAARHTGPTPARC